MVNAIFDNLWKFNEEPKEEALSRYSIPSDDINSFFSMLFQLLI